MLKFGIIPTSEFLYVITNHTTDAIKAVVHMVNMKFSKLKNNVRNTNKTRQLKQEVLELSYVGIHTGMQHQVREQKKFLDIKPVTVVKHVLI